MSVDATSTVWGMNPSIAGNVIFGIIFLGLTIGHIVLRRNYHSKFTNCLIAGGVFEILGYLIRAGATTNLKSVGPYAVQSLFLLLAPILFAATCYMTLGRTIAATKGEHLSILSLRWLTRVFVTGDIVCFWVQAGGGAMQAIGSGKSLSETGKWVVVVGLILQIAIFSGYVFTTFKFQQRVKEMPTPASLDPANPWKKIMMVIYAASFLITLRNIIRIAEYVEGFKGWIITHEFMLFVFDGALMAILMILLLVWHPGKLLTVYQEQKNDSVDMTFGMRSNEVLTS